jgi:hypothetical protein
LKTLFVNTFLVGALVFSISPASAQTFFTEDFESYADDAAFDAAWNAGSATALTLKTDGGHNGSNYAEHPAAAVRQGKSFATKTPTDAAPLVLDFWIRPNSALQERGTIGLGNGTTSIAPLLEVGVYPTTPASAGWEARLVNGAPTPASWAPVGGTRVPGEWTNLKVIVQSKDAVFYENGVKLATFSRTTTNFTAMNVVYIGTALSSAATTDFDDIVISTTSSVNDWSVY